MKNLRVPLLVFSFLGIGQTAFAQDDQQTQLINDMLVIADKFAAPGAEGAAIQTSAGWFSSASTLDKWKFEVSLHGNGLFVPSGKKNALITNDRDIKLVNVKGSNNALIPTVYGGDTNVMFELEFRNPLNGNVETKEFEAIDGLDKGMLLHPYPQVTVGLPYGTEVAVRFLPPIMVNDIGFSTYGAGIKHNFSQYIERRFDPEDFQFAAAATYSNFKVDYAFSQLSIPPFMELNRIDVNADLWLFQVLGSKLYDSFEVFGALGVTLSQFDYKMGGTGPALPLLNQELMNLHGNSTKFKGDIGFNYYFSNFKISSMFTASNFFNANIGLHYRI
ncbi:hypothetical protein FK178_14845 [Antarcticibacterium arcticum]|uniref:Uncharacterized protein n=1 Tax=Antarcticibacterium arcticum TaxID=2585771 RepID=A0A5B8YPT7_9FLAO|nr:DUF6588 family protein [Antarcticibacterium arcticum]QED38917.1 hypothetical protein FK178_14845 [Antarcticibacterium arcticum]